MAEKSLEEVIRTSEVIIHQGRYAYLKCQEMPAGEHFFVSRDDDEITVVTEESLVADVPHVDITSWFKLLEIRVSAPFVAKGFLAKVTRTVAEQNLNILMVSTYSKDYALVREESYAVAVDALKAQGFPLRFE